MKWVSSVSSPVMARSPPVRGAWVEIKMKYADINEKYTSPPVRGAWVEIISGLDLPDGPRGRPPCGGRGLKSAEQVEANDYNPVAPRAGGVG